MILNEELKVWVFLREFILWDVFLVFEKKIMDNSNEIRKYLV